LTDTGIHTLNALKKLRQSEIDRYNGSRGKKYAQNKKSKKVKMIENSINLTNLNMFSPTNVQGSRYPNLITGESFSKNHSNRLILPKVDSTNLRNP
jgi:hypothetical protein